MPPILLVITLSIPLALCPLANPTCYPAGGVGGWWGRRKLDGLVNIASGNIHLGLVAGGDIADLVGWLFTGGWFFHVVDPHLL